MVPAIVLIITNVALALGFGWALAKRLAGRPESRRSAGSWLLAVLGVYVAESMAFSASMATNILGYCLAFVWGILFARRLLAREMLLLSLYTCLPAVSFLSVLVLLVIGGWPLLSVEDGRRFGIPAFVPWPFCTLLGFVLTVSTSAAVFKTAITTITAANLRRKGTATEDQGGQQIR
jgi:hypothetical protein